MSGVALDVPVLPARPSFLRLLWAALLAYLAACVTLAALYLPLYTLGFMPRPFARPGPFPVEGAWSLDADLVVAAVIVLVVAWWIRRLVAGAVGGPVSLGVVAAAVAVTGYAPFLTLKPAELSGTISLLATTWIVGRYAIGTTLPFPRPSKRVWLVAALVGVAVFGSYQAYHPLMADGDRVGSFALWNPGWANLTILHVDGGYVAPGPWARHAKLPHTVLARGHVSIWADNPDCRSHVVDVTFSVLGRTSTQSFTTLPGACPIR